MVPVREGVPIRDAFPGNADSRSPGNHRDHSKCNVLHGAPRAASAIDHQPQPPQLKKKIALSDEGMDEEKNAIGKNSEINDDVVDENMSVEDLLKMSQKGN